MSKADLHQNVVRQIERIRRDSPKVEECTIESGETLVLDDKAPQTETQWFVCEWGILN